ncbi:MAG: alpha/beta hydrolase [Sphingomicrobium sp.]
MIEPPTISFLRSANGERIACRVRPGGAPAIVFLPGYASDMEGAKALAVDAFAAERGLACVRFDYSGTGSSEGAFEDATLDRWLDESLAVVDQLTAGPLILVGSSMGGWLALLIAARRPGRIKAIVGIATALDFTEWGFGPADRDRLTRDGRIAETNPDGSPGRFFTQAFWQSGQQLQLLGSPIAVDCPVRLIHGDADDLVPVSIATRTMDRLRSADVQLTIVKGGGHRLSEPREIDTILRTLESLLEPVR